MGDKVKLFKEIKGEIKECNCENSQIASMEKAGWSKSVPEIKKDDESQSKVKDKKDLK